MKIVFTKDIIISNLLPVMGTVSNKNTITSIEGVLIETLGGDKVRFSSYDMNKGTRMTFDAVEVIEEGSYIINAQRLLQIVRLMGDEEIVLTVDEKLGVTIESGRSSFSLYALSGKDFPSLPELSGETQLFMSCAVLKKMISRVIHSIAENDSRPALCGALFRMEENFMELISCDSYTLSRCSIRAGIRCHLTDGKTAISFILPGHALNELIRLLPDKEEEVRVSLARKHAIVEYGDLLFFTRMIDSEYFDYERILPKAQTIHVTCDRDRLLSGLERANLVAEEKIAGSGRSYVKLEVKGDTLSLTSVSVNGRVYDEMPCTHEGEDIIIGFNCRYLINSVRVADADRLSITLKSPNQAMTIEAAEEKEDEKFFYMILPVRMNEG